ncbi:MAG: hypothetical protein C4575_00665 [Desulforudis sp.]|jgi:hypothetical protein|nr:MAG: hypothetical protein C4575_00665 [Desulforudis sp.]
MATRRRLTIYVLSILGIALMLPLVSMQPAESYPPAGTGFNGWTAEATAPNAYYGYHAQLAKGDSYIYMIAEAPGNGGVGLWKASDTNTLNWTYAGLMDTSEPTYAADPYIDAEGSYVVASWKEHNGSTWGLVVAVSPNWGASWVKWTDSNPGWNNYEAHVDISGGKIHCAYVSDYGGRSEVYYRRFDLALNMEHLSCVSNNSDGVAASFPCIESTGASFANVYYQHGSSSPHPIYESWTNNWGSSWNITPDIIPTGGGIDFAWPEVAVFWEGADRRKMVVADGRNITTGFHFIYYNRYYNIGWQGSTGLCDLGTEPSYPQISSRDNDLLVVYRGSGGSTGNEGQGRINPNSGEGTWSFIDNLFYDQMPYNGCGAMDCCSDGSRFYASSCSWGSHIEVLTKREDNTDPNAAFVDPGKYHNSSWWVDASIADDFNHAGTFMLGPSPFDQAYEAGIAYAEFTYRKNNGPWQALYTDPESPWGAWFDGPGKGDGEYDFRIRAYDTAGRWTEDYLGGGGATDGIIMDSAPPTNVDLQVSAPDGSNGWYISQPGMGPSIVALDLTSGIKATYYKYDDAVDWTVFSTPFAFLEGEHVIHYYAEDNAGNSSEVEDFIYQADFTDPTGTIITPGGGEFFRTNFSMSVSADDALSGVARVDFYFASDLFASDDTAPFTKGCDISGYADGEREVQARIYDQAGRSAWTTKLAIKKDTKAPAVEITEPVGEEWIRGMVTCKANVTDDAPGEIAKVDWYIDGELFDSRTSAPWMGSLDTTAWSNEWHTISVKAWDKAGNENAEGGKAQVEQFIGNNISETNCFAEGCTRSGFDTWLCIQNPGDEMADVTVNYMLGPGQGQAAARNYAVPPHSRMTVNVNSDVGPDKDVSIQCTSTKPVVSERPMYFNYSGLGGHSWKGGHTAQGVSVPGQEWYLAEGCTRAGFEEWLCIQNPGDKAANVSVDYMLGSGQVIRKSYSVAAWQRFTISVNREIGPDQDVSVKVTSDQNIVVERPMYFMYQGVWDGGHNTMAVNSASTEWYFAEGCTRAGFNQWLCIQNPGEELATVDITYMTEDGTQIVKQAIVQPHSRHTINANVDVAREHDVSTKLTSDQPIIVERPMYFWYGNMGGFDEGSCAIGANKACSTWYLAEGCTRAGFEEWICLQNPNDEVATVRLTYMLENASCPEQVVNVAPRSRLTVRVNDFVGPDHDVSTEVQSDKPIIVERPMYSLYRGEWPSADSLNAYTFER